MLPRAILLSALLLAGCAGVRGPRAPAPVPSASASNDTVQATQAARYQLNVRTVVQGSDSEKAEVLAAARQGYEDAGRGPAALLYALLLAAPGHPQRNPQTALRLLQETLAHPELLSSYELSLAIVEKARVDDELGLVTENARLVAAEVQRERDRPRSDPATAALNRRLQAEIEENARLKKELEDAKSRLEAIANIERNTPARPPANEARKP